MSVEAAIRCQGLTKRYGSITAVDSLDLVVPPGSVFGFLGPNGSGKTTTIRILTGLSRPTAGRAWVAEEEASLTNLALKRRIGYLPEEPAYPGWMKGREVLALAAELYGLSGSEARHRVEELLALVGLEEAAERKVAGYSRGMRQRLGIGQALLNRSPVLILDEPCSALDPSGRREVLDLIASLRKEATVFLSTHILSDVEQVCDHVAILVRGQVAASGPLAEIRRLAASAAALVVQVETGTERLASLLKSQTWVQEVLPSESASGTSLRVTVRDLPRARWELLRLLAEQDFSLVRYEVATPTLEEAFFHLIQRKSRETERQ